MSPDTQQAVRTAGQRAYEGYVEAAEGRSLVSGAVLPAWAELEQPVMDAWHRAAAAARDVGDVRAQVSKVSPKRGDLVLLKVGSTVPQDVLHQLRTLTQEVLPDGAKALVLERGLELQAMRLRPGDVVMLGTTFTPTKQHLVELRAQVEQQVPGHPLLVVAYGRTIRTMTRTQVLELRDQLDGILSD